METSTNTATEQLSMVGVLKSIWGDLGDIVIYLGIIFLLYLGMKYLLTYLHKKNIRIPILSTIFIAFIGLFAKKVTKVYKDGKELEAGTSDIMDAIKEDLKKEEGTNEN